MNIIEKLEKLSEEFNTNNTHYGWWFSDRLDEVIQEIKEELKNG